MKKYSVSDRAHFNITGQLLSIQTELRLAGGSSIDPELVSLALEDIIQGKFYHPKNKANILRLISHGQTVVVEACNGSETIADSQGVFSTIDKSFRNLKINKSEPASKKTNLQVYELIKDASFDEVFYALGKDFDELCLTQHQIKKFCGFNDEWILFDGTITTFFFKAAELYFAAYVSENEKGLQINHQKLQIGSDAKMQCSDRLIVPKN